MGADVVPFAQPAPDDRDPVNEYLSSRWVPGLTTARELAIRPYPVNLYMEEGDSGSGIAGTLYPDGSFKALPHVLVPQDSEYWCDMFVHPDTGQLANGFIQSTVVWNGAVAGGTRLGVDGDGNPALVRIEDGSLLGMWPVHAPRYDRPVDPVKAQLAAKLDTAEAVRMASYNQEAA